MHFFRYDESCHPLFDIEVKYLQVWFQDLDFRHGVYDCKPTEPDDRFEVTRLVLHVERLVTLGKIGGAGISVTNDFRCFARKF